MFSSVYGVHGTLFDRLGLTVLTHHSDLKKKQWVQRYRRISAKNCLFEQNAQILTYFGQYLMTRYFFFRTDFCVEIVSSSRSKRVPWTLRTEQNFFWPLKGPCWPYFGIFQWRFWHKTPLNHTYSFIFVSIHRIHLRFSDFPTFPIFNPP